MNKSISCDIFCTVIDNFGDIGVCWRLARQLVHEHQLSVRLWVDDLYSFSRINPDIAQDQSLQHSNGVEIRRWLLSEDSLFAFVEPAQLVIEAYACELPKSYVAKMAMQVCKPVWINMEYLSAEDWVAGCHCLPSPHPSLPLVKYFFFQGFTQETGGLLLERDLLARRDAFQKELNCQSVFWKTLGLPMRKPDEIRISMFCYENIVLPELFSTWAQSHTPVLCLVPEGRILSQVAVFFRRESIATGDVLQQGKLQVYVIPFVAQERYDELLWACDINFVRGEDSFVRAQWAGKPFVWHIYPQKDNVHYKKLSAFMKLYCAELQGEATQALQCLWERWNGKSHRGEETQAISIHTWSVYFSFMEAFQQHAREWSMQLSGNNFVLNLLNFVRKIDKMQNLGCKSDLR